MVEARRNQIRATWDADGERALLSDISTESAEETLDLFSTLVRSSGSAEERRAVDYLRDKLDGWGIPATLYEPECFISIPISATLRVDEAGGASFRAKTCAMSVSTGGEEIDGELIHVPVTTTAEGIDEFSVRVDFSGVDVRGKVVLLDGMAAPGRVLDCMAAGALAGVFINPGAYIHESICTTIWGTPDLDSIGRQPTIPVVSIDREAGDALIGQLADGPVRVALSTTVDTGWRPIPVLVAEVTGSIVPDELVLVHGHIDSWHVGIGDNATGDATLLELARVLSLHRERLGRSVRIAWWSGHSHGRYAGSTWYADAFGIELAERCVAQINCDSPGCRDADSFDHLTCMSEAEPLVIATIEELTGITPGPERPPRAGDFSFNQVGLTGLMMLSSTMTDDELARRGLYGVGGCGGNIQWHTEDDTLEVADLGNLLRDMRVYAALVWRIATAPVVPLDYRVTVSEMRSTLGRYGAAAGDDAVLGPAVDALDRLDRSLALLEETVEACRDWDDMAASLNAALRVVAHQLVTVNYTRSAAFHHDSTFEPPPLPDLAPALELPAARTDPHRSGILRAHLLRGRNRLEWALRTARLAVEAVVGQR